MHPFYGNWAKAQGITDTVDVREMVGRERIPPVLPLDHQKYDNACDTQDKHAHFYPYQYFYQLLTVHFPLSRKGFSEK